jgi:hypothetical protein
MLTLLLLQPIIVPVVTGNKLPTLFFIYWSIYHYFLIIQNHFIMSFKARLKVAGKEVNVLACNYALKQETDATGRPSSITRGGKITLTVESTGDSTFFTWMCNNFERKDGSIVFVKRDTDATLKELNFGEAYLVEYRENFDSSNEMPVTETFTLSAKSIELGDGKHENDWV